MNRMVPKISMPNKKTGVYSFSISNRPCRQLDGPKEQGCTKYCYANKAWRLYPSFRKMMIHNLRATKKESFVDDMVHMIDALQVKMFRIHVSGEFYDNRYFFKWVEIAKQLSSVKFYCYTKQIALIVYPKPANLIIYLSDDKLIWKEYHKFFDGVTTIVPDRFAKIPKGFKVCLNQVSKYNKAKNKPVTCGECRLCTKRGKRIAFIKH